MDDLQDSAEAPPKQSFIERQLGEAITPPEMRAKLKADMDAYFKEIDEGGSTPEPAKTPASAKATNIELVPGPATLPPDILAELEEGRTARRAVGLVRSPEFIQAYVKPKDEAYHAVIDEMAQHFTKSDPAEVQEKFLQPLKRHFTAKALDDQWLDEQLSLTDLSDIGKAKIRQKFENAKALERQYEEAATVEMTRAQSEYEQKQAVRNYMAELNSALQNGRYKYFADLRQRVQRKEPGAQEEVTAVDAELQRRVSIDVSRGIAMGAAIHMALDALNKSEGGSSNRGQPSSAASTSSSQKAKTLPVNARESLDDAFERYLPTTPGKRSGGFYKR
jgi:hypothetical protein